MKADFVHILYLFGHVITIVAFKSDKFRWPSNHTAFSKLKRYVSLGVARKHQFPKNSKKFRLIVEIVYITSTDIEITNQISAKRD